MYSLPFLLDDGRIRIRTRKDQKHMDPTDPDPQHCAQQSEESDPDRIHNTEKRWRKRRNKRGREQFFGVKGGGGGGERRTFMNRK
jgi:hypothetical protein